MNNTREYEFTIIVPIYNEQDNLERLEKTLRDYLPTALYTCCVLLINDGSKDNSLQMIKDICQRNRDFFYISSSANHGLSTAMKAGIDTVESKYIGYIDSDLQTTPEDFNLLLQYAPDYQLVSGIRAKRKDSWFKKLQSKIANGFRRKMTGDTATDTGCPLKVMWTDYAKRLPFFDGMHRFLPALMNLEDGKFKEMPVRHFPRIAGVSKYHLWNRLAGPFKDCFAYRWMKKRYIRYQIDDDNVSL
ncbi:MAG: glycosyltransferase [Prevotella sp.]|jgi:glycosyltransferase involved in cell wall biosynthesis|nr:glycosyltransferase [Prevotella sp.]MCI2079523.1 glycosyltransferase [Prevotella sp.]MCI2101554.1 glycosyltransferase [Prevotella sp.]